MTDLIFFCGLALAIYGAAGLGVGTLLTFGPVLAVVTWGYLSTRPRR